MPSFEDFFVILYRYSMLLSLVKITGCLPPKRSTTSFENEKKKKAVTAEM